MSGGRLGYCEDTGARPQGEGVWTRGESVVEFAKTGDRYRAVAARHGPERGVELGAQVRPMSEQAKVDDRAAHRHRRHELWTLQRLRCVRQYREPTVYAAFPIIPPPSDRVGGQTAQIAQ